MKKLTKPGFYTIPEAEYHKDPCIRPSLSCSIIKVLINRSPIHAWIKHPRLNKFVVPEKKKAFDLGSAAHKMFLGAGADYTVLDFPNYMTNAAKEAREACYEAGETPLLTSQYENVAGMVEAARRQLEAFPVSEYFFAKKAESEKVMVWKEPGIGWGRGMCDRLADGNFFIFDYKTTAGSANPESWGKRMVSNLGYDIQAAWYSRGVKALTGKDPLFIFIVQEIEPPYALSLVQLSPTYLEIGERKVEEALKVWSWCLKNKVFPGYPPTSVVCDPPGWEAKTWLGDEDRSLSNAAYEFKNAREAWDRAQAPATKRGSKNVKRKKKR